MWLRQLKKTELSYVMLHIAGILCTTNQLTFAQLKGMGHDLCKQVYQQLGREKH